ncbi:MAG TPA: DNA-formamidopyrimidine glycosylase family protein [Polyangiaceae bacterium]|nr:DNA-formamidopyrimidine glycosylase family protein [Polyangiaceae bacterium]
MPELPDVEVYLLHLRRRVEGEVLERVRVASPFLVRSFDPPLKDAFGKRVTGLRRLGKRIVFDLEDDLHLVLHLMVAGRLRWKDAGAAVPAKVGLAAFDFAKGSAILTEASTKKRASLHVARGEAGVEALDPGGIEPMAIDVAAFAAALRRENHTIKRALTDPRLLSGIGNAYSDEILWQAQMSPVRLTQKMTDDEMARLFSATQDTLRDWTYRLAQETGDDFPEKVTAFRDEMAVHGRYKKPCPRCGSPVQRIAYADNESNYCARCQTGGKLLADRGLSRLLKGDWPKTLDELETRMRRAKDSLDAADDPEG